MKINITQNNIIVPSLLLFFIFCFLKTNACDKNIIGSIAAPNNIISSGEIGCVVGDFSGSITVQSGGELRICGQYTFAGSINVSTGGKVVITAGSSIGVVGSLTFNDYESLEYQGDPNCNAEIYAITVNSCFVTWGAVPGLAGNFCNFNNIFIDGFSFAWGPSTIGAARNGRAPSLCPGGSSDCFEVLLSSSIINFEAKKINRKSLLQWSATTEKNHDYYSVERSEDALNWQSVGELISKGGTGSIQNYQFTDHATSKAGVYYRIKQYTTDGLFTTSKIQFLESESEYSPIRVAPNPSNGLFELILEPNHAFNQYKIMDLLGKIIATGQIHTGAIQKIDLSHLSNGLYWIILGDNNTIKKKILITEQ